MKLITLLPFMDSEDLKELADKILKKEVKGVPIVTLYPFLDSEELDEIIDKLVKEKGNKALYSALPFMSKKRLDKLYEDVKAGNLPGFKESTLLPFLGKDKIKDLFNDLVEKAQTEGLEDAGDENLADTISDAISDAFDE